MYNYNYNPYIKFLNIESEVYKLILDNGIKESYNPDEFIIKPYEYIEYVYFIDRGLVKYTTSNLDGKEQILVLISTGACTNSAFIILGSSSYEYYYKTILPTEVYKIPKDIFIKLFNSSIAFRDYIIKNDARYTGVLMKLICTKTLFSQNYNLYDFLVYSINLNSVHDSVWYKLNYNFTQNQLANILGISLTSTNRTLQTLCDEGKIKIVNKKIEVNVPEETFKQYFEHYKEIHGYSLK